LYILLQNFPEMIISVPCDLFQPIQWSVQRVYFSKTPTWPMSANQMTCTRSLRCIFPKHHHNNHIFNCTGHGRPYKHGLLKMRIRLSIYNTTPMYGMLTNSKNIWRISVGFWYCKLILSFFQKRIFKFVTTFFECWFNSILIQKIHFQRWWMDRNLYLFYIFS